MSERWDVDAGSSLVSQLTFHEPHFEPHSIQSNLITFSITLTLYFVVNSWARLSANQCLNQIHSIMEPAADPNASADPVDIVDIPM